MAYQFQLSNNGWRISQACDGRHAGAIITQPRNSAVNIKWNGSILANSSLWACLPICMRRIWSSKTYTNKLKCCPVIKTNCPTRNKSSFNNFSNCCCSNFRNEYSQRKLHGMCRAPKLPPNAHSVLFKLPTNSPCLGFSCAISTHSSQSYLSVILRFILDI